MSKLDTLVSRLKGKFVEICIGDEYEELLTSDSVKKVNSTIYGRLIEMIDDFVVIDCFYVDKTDNNAIKTGNIVYINAWHIKIFTEIGTEGCLNDALLSASHARKIRSLVGINE